MSNSLEEKYSDFIKCFEDTVIITQKYIRIASTTFS
jgi:hypothetical protein